MSTHLTPPAEGWTVASARAELGRRLVFGNDRQIMALAFLQQVKEVRARMLRCRKCWGAGLTLERESKEAELCRCIEDEPLDVLRAVGLGRQTR